MINQLTLEKLKAMKPDTIFASGTEIDSPKGISISNTGKQLRWIAVRGGIHDWAIYVHFSDKPEDWIRDYGDKIHMELNIRKCVDCDDEAYKMYRS